MSASLEHRLYHLIDHPHFRQFALETLNAAGIPLQRGQDPAVVFLTNLQANDPQSFGARAARMLAEHERVYPTPPEPAQPAAPRSEFWEKAFGDDKAIVAEYDKLPANSKIRESAKSPQMEAYAIRSGIGAFPGKSRAETLAAYLLAGSKVKATSAAYRELEAALGGKETVEQLRKAFRVVGAMHGTDEMVAHMERRDKERLGDREEEVPRVNKEVQEESDDRARWRKEVGDAWDRMDAAGSKKRKTLVDNRDRLHMELAWRKASGEGTDDIELSPQVAKEVTEEKLYQKAGNEAVSQMAEDLPEPIGNDND